LRYIKAKNVLPEEIIKIIQEYVDGEYIYVPRKNGNEKAWGEKNGSRSSFTERNIEIYNKYKDGTSIKELAKQYYLCEHSIRRIVKQEILLRTKSIQNGL
jgi:Mor family transcriptional regulator